MEFPHLSDTAFPLLNNVNVYSYKNEFDYTRWVPNTRVKLTNVLWHSDYTNVVKFGSDSERDAWFDSQEGAFDQVLRENHTMPPEGVIKLPIPFDVAVRYNYLVVDIPTMTSDAQPIMYEDADKRVRRWFFFVNEVSSRAPNTTVFDLSLDVWTQFQNDIDIKYMFLERGHAPVAATDTDAYLADPINNNDWLLTPDVTPSSANVVRHSRLVQMGEGKKFLCIASTARPDQLANLGSRVASESYSYGELTFSDTSARYGYQLHVDGYGTGDGYDWSSMKNRVSPEKSASANGRIPNNTTIYAIDATEVYHDGTFFEDVIRRCPVFMHSIVATFMVDRDMFEPLQSLTFVGHRLYEVRGGVEERVDISLSKAQFHYPQRYQRFAKLYTYPYAEVELTDNEGKSVTVRIENTHNISAVKVAELAFPFVKSRVYFTGINGQGSDSYSWRNLWDTETNNPIPRSDWFDYCFDHEIPCYALYLDPETEWYLDNFNKVMRGSREQALAAYHNTVRGSNTACENAVDMDATVAANTKASNATMKANTDRDASTLRANARNVADTATANVELTVVTNTDLADLAKLSGNAIKNANNIRALRNKTAANTFTTTTSEAQAQTSVSTAFNTNCGTIWGQAAAYGAAASLAGGAAGTILPGAGNAAGAAAGLAVGSLVGFAQAVANAAANSANAVAAGQLNTATAVSQVSCNDESYNASVEQNDTIQTQLNLDIGNNNTFGNKLLQDHTKNNNDCNIANANNTATTMQNNASATKTTGDANAEALQGTSDDNARYTRLATVNSAKETLRASRSNGRFAPADAGMGRAIQVGSYSGDPTADFFKTRGVQVKVRTMADADVRQVGDWFARFGYKVDSVWDVGMSGLCPMEHFCYWKCHDVWVDDRMASNGAAMQLITAMFERGVTIWKRPEEIGRVSVYDN